MSKSLMLQIIGYCFFFLSLGFLSPVSAQESAKKYVSLSDTNRYGNLTLYYFKGWTFSFDAPNQIKDQINLTSTQEVPNLYDLTSIFNSDKWNKYGWFEIELEVDSTLVGVPFVLSYHSQEAIKVWINGKEVLQAGNPSKNPEQEVLARMANPTRVGIVFREGSNTILVELSGHQIGTIHRAKRYFENGIMLMLFKNFESYQRIDRSFIFGGTLLLLFNLILIHLFLAYRFKGSYHLYVALLTFFLLLHSFATMSDTLINWTFQYSYFFEYTYALAYIFVVYFFIIAIRKYFELSIKWLWLNSICALFVLGAISIVLHDSTNIGFFHQFIILMTLVYGWISLSQAWKLEKQRSIVIIASGFALTVLGTFLYSAVYLVIGQQINWLLYLSTLMSYTSIPISLTLIVATSYAKLITTLEEKVQDRTAKLESANEFQKRFFANVSHEFRTPLTISEGLIDKLLNTENLPKEKIRYDLSIAKRNMLRLHDMVNQIIELTKADHHELILHKKSVSISNIISICVESFRSLAEYRGHTYSYKPLLQDAILEVDITHFEIILNNLISNAIKFTPDAGEIRILVEVINQQIHIVVCDTGHGIPDDKKESVFERFHRITQPEGDYVEGMGVGLELSRMLARLHDGEIYIRDNHPKGSCFELVLPIQEIVEESIQTEINTHIIPEPDLTSVNEFVKNKAHRILLVEDNEDLMHYISGILEELGEIVQAKNGLEALEKLELFNPDIIVTDLMMPKLSGLELVQRLAVDPKRKDIPIVVVTAKALDEEKTKLLRIGVVDYITKPFSAEQLVLKTGNLLKYYDQKRELKLGVTENSIPKTEAFGQKVADFIYEQIRDSALSVDILAAAFSMSRSTFYRNLESETGMSPSEFIREVRLTTSREIVAKNPTIRLEELANSVGYKSATSFRKMYQDRFGEHPIAGKV